MPLIARTILVDWFNLDGYHVGFGSYITTQSNIDSIIDELIILAEKGKRPGLEPIEPNGVEEFAITAVLKPLAGAIATISDVTLKVPFDSEIPSRLVNLYEFISDTDSERISGHIARILRNDMPKPPSN